MNKYRQRFKTITQRFEELWIPVTESGCWLWVGNTSYRKYGLFKYKGIQRSAHRCAYEIYKGIIPAELYVLHKCDVTECVNPDHLWLGTARDNMIDMVKKGRTPLTNLIRGLNKC